MTTPPNRELLCRLADAFGVASEYWAYSGQLTPVPDETLVKVLASMGVDAGTEESVQHALHEVELSPWREVLPPCTVIREHTWASISVHVPHGSGVSVEVILEDDGVLALQQIDDHTPPRDVDGVLTGRASFSIPATLPLGYHTIRATVTQTHGPAELSEGSLIIAPQRLPSPAEKGAHGWGAMAQLYSVRSKESWGIGDTADLKELCSLFGERGGDFVLINPLHAAEPSGHLTPSPYLPVTRRFFNPLYIRPEDIPEFDELATDQRERVLRLGQETKAASLRDEDIDRDASWAAKQEALNIIFRSGLSPARQREFARFRAAEGQGLEDFAFWCGIREKYGEVFPAELSGPTTPAATAEREALAERIDFFAWLQWIIDGQLAAAQRSALEAGMPLGIFHDLAVGIHPGGVDTWSIPQAFAAGVTVGAPPDMYNQRGQDWSQPPWRPDSMRRMSYAPLRDMARTVLRHAGALRVDHVMGFFRLWWIPAGSSPDQGAYVYFDHEAMIGVLMLEAYRAGAVVVGEDLGNVEPWVADYLNERGILGTSVLWFETDWEGQFKRPDQFRRKSLVTVDTHDLPPLASYLAGEHVDLRNSLGMLAEPVEKMREAAADECHRMVNRLREYGLVGEDPSEQEIIEAMHCYIAETPAEMLAIALVDAVGDRRPQNMPGTNNEYANWRVPLTDGDGNLVLVEDLADHPRLVSLIDKFTAALR
ncbi:MAG: 4-alpha-glucanotransferase [Ancrocorticia sp.]